MLQSAGDRRTGWKTVGVVLEGQPIQIGGLNVWDYDWTQLQCGSLELPHPSYPSQLHSMSVYEITAGAKCIQFAAGELSPNVWGFFVPDYSSADAQGADLQ